MDVGVLLIPSGLISVIALYLPRNFVGIASLPASLALLAGIVGQLIAHVRWGQSIGKRSVGIRVVVHDGQPAELWRIILLRNAVPSIASAFCRPLTLIDVLFIFGAEHRCLHDYLAGTRVVKAAAEANATPPAQ